MSIGLFHALRTKIAFGNHFHFNLCAFHAIPLANHCAKGAVSREVRVTRNQQVTKIDAVVDIAFEWMYCRKKTRHLLNGIGHEHRLEVIAIFQATANACRYSIDIL